MEEKVNYWMIVAGGGGKVWSLFKDENIACIDFDSNLSNILGYKNPQELKQGKQRNLFIWKFAHDIKINDYIIATSGFNKILGIGQCVKTYYFDETKTEFKHCIGVNWLKVDGGWKYKGKKGARQTINWDRNKERIDLYKSILNGTYRENKEKVVMNKNINHYLDKLVKSKNLILRGAPGTGKTYLAKEIALELTGGNEDQIEFVQFHPSYDYTDFVEGLRPDSNEDGTIDFKLQDGIFKKFCQLAKEAQKIGGQDNFDEAWDLYLEYVNSRDEKEYLTEFSYLTVNSRNNFNVNYETKAQGTVLTREYVYELYKDEKYPKQLYYRSQGKKVLETLRKKFGLKEYVSPIGINADKKFVFIIDEINRGEISKIFGELFFSIDPGYRGEKGSVSTQYANLHETDEKFYIPENIYIIGTMNDIDRSVDTFDFAMRRRFRFVEVTAESQLGMLDDALGDKAEEAKARLRNLNAEIEKVQELNSHYHIGPSYFLKLEEVDFDYELLWSDYLKPLLEDYLRGSYEEDTTLNTLKKAYNLTNQQDIGDDDADN
ncbi:AAA family ATPase [Streptococcus infantis]|uniref:AAA family ATPase n=1 Tax=Streptococcus infantis TaxID=68892 RepID=UPI001CBF74AD|nr:AAA family ATPase [Streptococcus infantis]MBZ2119298.1 AAA family ATPase [Streptococcus infantis]MBZ2121330.1 AAA family ATPase [Streptococcus infantis]MBZ2125104.1 AAA family ATPase [Streptococcus infantis]